MGRPSARQVAALVLVGLWLLPEPVQGQWPRERRSGGTPDFDAFNVSYDGRFVFVRLRFTPSVTGYRGGGGYFGGVDYQWDHDYPRAERHFTTILEELTALVPRTDSSNILAADDPELFHYPVAYMAEPGYWTVTDAEATKLGEWLRKGGFLIVDDFAGSQWLNFERVMQQVLPHGRFIQLDPTHPLFNSFYAIESLDHVHPYYNVPSVYYGIFEDNDPTKRLMVIANYNNDLGESWEWSDTGWIPIPLSNEAYKLGVNYIVYAMTH